MTIDDGADLITVLHAAGARARRAAARRDGGDDDRARPRPPRSRPRGALACPVLAVNEARSERAFNDRYGTGQSTLDGILRATNLLLAGHTVVVLGYGWTGRGVAQRARGAGASVIVCEVDPLAALEARMEGFEVMPALDAAERGDVFVTVTGARDVLARRALRAHEGRRGARQRRATSTSRSTSAPCARWRRGGVREVRPLVEQYDLGDRRLNLLARGRVVNLAAAEGHPAAVMDISFALQALCVEELVRRGGELGAGRARRAAAHRPRGGDAQARRARRAHRRRSPTSRPATCARGRAEP